MISSLSMSKKATGESIAGRSVRFSSFSFLNELGGFPVGLNACHRMWLTRRGAVGKELLHR